MAMPYNTYSLYMQTMVVSQPTVDVDFTNILPAAIDYAEQRCYRDLDLLNTLQTDATTTLGIGNRTATIPNTFVIVNSMAVLTPAGSSGSTGTRNPLTPASIDVINALWPAGSAPTGVPSLFAMTDQWQLILGPAPDGAYSLEVVGTYRPPALSATNPNTFLTDRVPDLFVAASMIFFSGYMRNFGAQANDPQMGTSWEGQYELLLKSANGEEERKHMRAASWTSRPIAPTAQPQRG